MFDHGLLYGDGIFEGIRFSRHGILLFQEHVERLYVSAKTIRLGIPYFPKELMVQVSDAVAQSGLKQGYIRLLVTRGAGDLGLNPTRCAHPQVITIVSKIALYPDSLYESGLHVHVCKTLKPDASQLPGNAKTCNYLNNILAVQDYLDANCHEGLMLTKEGFVSEATADNVFFISGNTLFTPSLATNCLPGITRAKVMQVAAKKGYRIEEGLFTPDRFRNAEEMFLTGTGAGIIAVAQIDGFPVGSGRMGPKTRALRQAFEINVPMWSTPVLTLRQTEPLR